MGSNAAQIDAVAVPLDADRLDVYRLACEFDVFATRVLPRRGCAWLRDQLQRASSSVALNIAEAMVSHCLPFLDDQEKSRGWSRQVAEATSIRSPRRRPRVT
jgi:23S rRNA-intervening sequence protein